MKELRRNEFIDMLEMAEILYEAKDKFIKCDIPSLGAVTYYPKADKLHIDKNNQWVEQGFEYVKTILVPITQKYKPNLSGMKRLKSDGELRDEFAMRAMQGLVSNNNNFEYLRESTPIAVAEDAYKIADAMMKQRKLKTE